MHGDARDGRITAFSTTAPTTRSKQFDAIFMRKDPPADAPYLFATMLLSLADRRRTFVLNEPAGLREANEKLYALNFPDAIPPTLVSQDLARLKKFMAEQGGQMIVKPLDGHGGESVFLAAADDRNLNAILEAVTRFESRPIMAQRYLAEIRDGDKRLIVLDGEPLGCTLRVPRDDENRGNIHVGGNCVKAEITARDREICAMMRPRLKRDGLYFVGLDIIGNYLTEVNVTSPTGIQEIDRLDERQPRGQGDRFRRGTGRGAQSRASVRARPSYCPAHSRAPADCCKGDPGQIRIKTAAKA